MKQMEFETYTYAHIIGSLYGQALGDACGMPAYFHPNQTWEYFDGWLEPLQPAPDDHPLHAGFQAGQVTDDTYLTIALAKAVIAEGQVTAEGAAQAIINWYDQLDGDNTPAIDPGLRRIVAALKTGTAANVTGLEFSTLLWSMGISPLGLIHAGDPDAAIEDTVTVCVSTGASNVAVSGACAVAAAVAQAVLPDTTLEEIVDMAIHGAQLGFRHGTPGLGASVARKIDMAVNWALQADISNRDCLQNFYDFIGSTLCVADVVPCALGVLTMANGNPVDTAIYAANLSGKADTVGAIAGAIAGAWQTTHVISDEYLDCLRQANPDLGFEDLADGLFELAKENYRAMPQVEEDTLTTSFLDELASTQNSPE
jgi:ADP-ribosylglycohydrolase